MIEEIFSEYAALARKADILFRTVQEKYPDSVRCRVRCSDCCHAVFGLFPVEAAFINYHFSRLERKARRDVLRRTEKSETEMLKAKDTLKVFDEDPKMKVYGLGKQRVRCPFLSDKEECVFYEKRPVICRIYGVPYSLQKEKKEHSYVCGVSGFQEKAAYPTVKLDRIYTELCKLSEKMLTEGKALHPDRKANLMMPLSRILRMPFEDIVSGKFEE
ncbi:MAG: YkgJ family cysteine cluster protein [Nitrospirota bacterium]